MMQKIIGLLLMLVCIAPLGYAETLYYTLHIDKNEQIYGESLPKPKYLGFATLKGGVKIPAYQVFYFSASNGDEPMTESPEDLQINAKLDKKLASQFAVYYAWGGWFLIPKDWVFVDARTGGTRMRITFSPAKGKGYFSFWNNFGGGCPSCSLDVASRYFKQADVLNQKKYGAESQYLDTFPKVHVVDFNKNLKAWRTTINGQNIDGITTMYIDDYDNIDVMNVEVSLPKSQAHLATPILNWYIK